MAAPPAPLPPDIQQQMSPQGAQSAFAAQGLPQQQPGMQAIQMMMQKIQEQERWLQDMAMMIQQVHPPLIARLQPVAQGLLALRGDLQQLAQRSGMAQGSPVMPGAPPGNPAAGPPSPMGM